eukprot:gene26068-31927_t
MNSVYWEHRGQFHTEIDPKNLRQVSDALDEAARAIHEADALLFCTGAGMGVDMGLQDFRSSKVFWEELAHPDIKCYEDSSDNKWFDIDPEFAWGLNFHQLKAYREAAVHEGYEILLELAKSKKGDYFCWTSNIDGVFQRAGFDPERVRENH